MRRSLTMNKFVKSMMLTVVSLMTITFFTACDKEMANEPLEVHQEEISDYGVVHTNQRPPIKEGFSEYGLLAYPNGTITIEDFKKTGKLLTRTKAQELVEEGKLGKSPENALVQPFFHKNGNLYTPHEFNSSGVKEDFLEGGFEQQWTVDLKTFQEVTGLKEASGDYARDFGEFWIFDPLVKFYETREEKELLGKKKKPISFRSASRSPYEYQNYLKKGNMLYGEWQWWSPANYTGHTAGIVNSPSFGPMCYAGDEALKKVIVVEGMPSSGVVEHCPIYSYSDSKDWRYSNMTKRCVMYTSTEPTALQRETLQEFQEKQLGKNWWFPLTGAQALANKEKNGSFYCSKLQWLAYKTVMGLDLDRDGGPWVFPRDILYDNDVNYIEF